MTQHLRQHEAETARERATLRLPPLGQILIAQGTLTATQVTLAQTRAQRGELRLADVLYARFGLSRHLIARAEAELYGCPVIDPLARPADPRLMPRYGAHLGLRHALLPWRRLGGCTVILSARPESFAAQKPALERIFGPVRMAITTPDHLQKAICARYETTLVARAESRVALEESSRGWRAGRALRLTLAGLTILASLTWLWPGIVLLVLTGLASALMILTGLLKLTAAIIGRPPQALPLPDPLECRLPVITLLVPLYHEKAIADHLLSRLEALEYPRELLDVCLVLESGDSTTREALGRVNLLTWMRAVTVPDGTIKTKPRAMNYALDFARGSIVGVYDAEDAPATDQLRIVARHFAAAGPEVACLQGVLDYYNSATNWLTRCFTIEYASWFRVVLPGFARMGLVVPLGGTTLFFRRSVLEELDGWDAHNVTEDADLGVRLARHGYRTEFMPSVTEEEANGRAWPWVKQRSRWLKGYAITYGVHMRRPAQLWRDLGTWRFFGIQILFAGTLSQFLLAPLIWTFWLVPFGWPHPLSPYLAPWMIWTLAGLFVSVELIHFGIAALALKRARKLWLLKWVPTLQLYFPLGVAATYRGLLELTWRPFFWDKTAHGIFMPKAGVIPPPPPLRRRVADG